jgi:spore maturation protein CgeD
MSKVSVLLTVYNKPQWLRQCIDSVIDQTYENWELIILDDNSPDPMVQEILSSYEDKRIEIYTSNVSQEDRYKTVRYATLINYGVRNISTGDYITYLTDDDYYYHDRLERMVTLLDDDRLSIVYGSQDMVDADGEYLDTRFTQGILDSAYGIVDHNSVMHKRELFYEVEGWPNNPDIWFHADAHFWNKLTSSGYQFFPVEAGPLGAKRYHNDSVQSLMQKGEFFL